MTPSSARAAARSPAAKSSAFLSRAPNYDRPKPKLFDLQAYVGQLQKQAAPIVILDEATASIDPENEHLIQQAISELTRGKTIITIAHRLATIQNADQILVVADGRIAEHGTHAELVQQDGLYRRFTAIREQAEGWRIAAE